jgi:predicted metalloprotease with PDZ domain
VKQAMGRAKIGLVAAALQLFGAKAPPSPVMLYAVGVADARHLAVEIRLTGSASGQTKLALPGQWAGTKELWRGVSDLAVEGGAVAGEGRFRTIRHPPGAALVVRYRVVSGGQEMDAGEKARPTVEPDWFFFHGEGVFATVEGRDKAPARFRWGRLPAGWKAASDLDYLRDRAGTVTDIVESTAVAGKDLALAARTVGPATLRVAAVGRWDFPADALAARVATIMAAEHAFWREPPEPFIVTLAPLPVQPGVSTFTGTGRGDGFSLLSTPGLNLDRATRVLAHEYMHRWVPFRLGGQPEEAAREFWFSEGFDDYLTSRVLYGSGIWTFADYLDDANRVLLRYATNPSRMASGAEIAAKFWQDPNIEQLPYDRGHLLALLLDARLRTASRGRIGLDDVLRAQRKAARTSKLTGAPLFLATLKAVTGRNMGGEIARIADGAAPLVLPANAFGPCARVETVRRPRFTRGFDLAATEAAGMSVRGTDPAGPAWSGGMRDGMRILAREAGEIGDASREIAYRVDDKGTERVIRYLPASRETFLVPQAVPAALGAVGATDAAACRRLLGGA